MVPWTTNVATEAHSEFGGTSDFSLLLECMNTVDNFEHRTLPNVIRKSIKMVSTTHQYHFLTASRYQGTIPCGIAKQSIFRYSINGAPLQEQLQNLYNFTASRALDMMITETHNRMTKHRKEYYSSLNKAKLLAEDIFYDLNTFEVKLNKTISKTKRDCIEKHKRKLKRDLDNFKIYTNIDGKTHQVVDPPPGGNTVPSPTNNTKKKKRSRRFKKPMVNNSSTSSSSTATTQSHPTTSKPNKQMPKKLPSHRSHGYQLKKHNPTSGPTHMNSSRYFHNLTSIELNEAQKSILTLGSKFCPTPNTSDRAQFETDIDNWIYKVRWAVKIECDTEQPKPKPLASNILERQLIKKSHTTPIINSGKPALELFIQKVREELLINPKITKNVYSNLTGEQNKALKEMCFWESDLNIVFRPYDKGEGVFIDYKDNYKVRVLTELNSDNYEKILDNTSMRCTVYDAIKNWCDRWSSEPLLTPKILEWVTPDVTKKPGKFYLNYKKHKPEKNFPGRLITSGCGSLTENISILTSIELKKRAHMLTHVILDTNALLRKIDDVNDSEMLLSSCNRIIHASFDVIAMFPNMHKNIGLMMCKNELDLRTCGLPTQCVLEAIEISLDYNIAEFDGSWYRQVVGTAMGPHNSCEYCDIGMSYIDNMVHSEQNPYRSCIIMWIRFRDDIYTPWTHGEELLLRFFDWLNSIDNNIKFTVQYSEQGVEFLDTYIYDRDGKIHTKLYSKDSDTFAYLPPHSCHPYHICKNNPDQIARRVCKINSEADNYGTAKIIFSDHLSGRGYPEQSVSDAFAKFENIPRSELYNPQSVPNNMKKKERCFPLVTEYNPHLPKVTPVLNKYKHLLDLDPAVTKIVPPNSIFASFRQPKSIGNMLVHSTFKSTSNQEIPTSADTSHGCNKCEKSCHLCRHFLVTAKTFKSYSCEEVYTIKQNLNCQSEGIIYLLSDNKCNRSYVGSTINSMSKRFSNYKSHIKTAFEGCEVATHFHSCGDVHSIDFDCSAEAYAKQLAKHLSVTIIDQVDLHECRTRKEKRAKIEIVEGQWQTNLRTLLRYGGLNRKDERKISNNRSARGNK